MNNLLQAGRIFLPTTTPCRSAPKWDDLPAKPRKCVFIFLFLLYCDCINQFHFTIDGGIDGVFPCFAVGEVAADFLARLYEDGFVSHLFVVLIDADGDITLALVCPDEQCLFHRVVGRSGRNGNYTLVITVIV